MRHGCFLCNRLSLRTWFLIGRVATGQQILHMIKSSASETDLNVFKWNVQWREFTGTDCVPWSVCVTSKNMSIHQKKTAAGGGNLNIKAQVCKELNGWGEHELSVRPSSQVLHIPLLVLCSHNGQCLTHQLLTYITRPQLSISDIQYLPKITWLPWLSINTRKQVANSHVLTKFLKNG